MDQVIVIGYGRFGQSMACSLQKLGKKVMVIDKDIKLINTISDLVSYSLSIDATNLNSLKFSGISHFDTAIIAFSSDIQASILTTINLKELGIKYIIAKANNENHAKILTKLGADKVVFPEKEMGEQLANNLKHSNFHDILCLSSGYSIAEIQVLKEWHSKSLDELEISTKYKSNIIAIKRNDTINIFPTADDIVKYGDILVVIGSITHLKDFQMQALRKENA